jgi:hypothetical protein
MIMLLAQAAHPYAPSPNHSTPDAALGVLIAVCVLVALGAVIWQIRLKR